MERSNAINFDNNMKILHKHYRNRQIFSENQNLGRESESGQALLIVILISSVLLTIGLSLTSITTQETRIAKLQEDSSRARAAAEAGIDYLLDLEPEGEIQLEDILPVSDDITGTAEIITETSSTFTTPFLKKDGQYTFYLTGYDLVNKNVIDGTFNDSIVIDKISPLDSSSCGVNALAVEITFINVNDGIVTRRLIDEECDIVNGEANEADIDFGDAIDTSLFTSDPHVMILRIIAPSTSFEGGILRVTRGDGAGLSWPAQGRTFISEAQTGGLVVKKVRLFQSHPQFPGDFFMTSF